MAMSPEKSEKILSDTYADVASSAICENTITSHDIDLQIIVPVYKAEEFLRTCLDSILNQKTKYKFKVVVVNDGSPDRCGEILGEYSSDDRVIVHTQENKGHSGARNTALKEIFAKYVAFVDSDDEIPQGSIEAMMKAAYENDADIVQGGLRKRTLDGRLYAGYTHGLNTDAPKSAMKGFPCGKLFKSELLRNICFPEKYWFEDSNVSMLIMPQAKRFVTIPEVVYYYVTNPESISNTYKGKVKSLDSFYVTRALLADQQRLIDKGQTIDYSIDLMFEQIAINWQRTFSLGLECESAIFVLTCDILNSRFPNTSLSDTRYPKLLRSLKEKDFATYRRECAFL